MGYVGLSLLGKAKVSGRNGGQFTALCLSLVWLPGDAISETLPIACSTQPVSVVADDPEIVCKSVSWAIDRLAACNLDCRSDVTIHVADDPDLPWDNCLAAFDCAQNRIDIVSPSHIGAILRPESGFAAVESTTLFESLVVHEMVHACVNPLLGLDPDAVATAEYAPYALQLDYLPATDREGLLHRYPASGPVSVDQLGPMSLGFDPAFFATRAWMHFTGPDGGCAFLHALIEGTARLPPLPDWD